MHIIFTHLGRPKKLGRFAVHGSSARLLDLDPFPSGHNGNVYRGGGEGPTILPHLEGNVYNAFQRCPDVPRWVIDLEPIILKPCGNGLQVRCFGVLGYWKKLPVNPDFGPSEVYSYLSFAHLASLR
jgi:hypothetical protein